MRDQQRKYEAAESDYARISRQLDEFDTHTETLRAEAQQLMLQVEEANAEIRTITEQNAGERKPAGSFAERNRTRERADPQRQR